MTDNLNNILKIPQGTISYLGNSKAVPDAVMFSLEERYIKVFCRFMVEQDVNYVILREHIIVDIEDFESKLIDHLTQEEIK